MEKRLELEKLELELEKYSRLNAILKITKKEGTWFYTWLNKEKKEFSYNVPREISKKIQYSYLDLNESLDGKEIEVHKAKNKKYIMSLNSKKKVAKEITRRTVVKNNLEECFETLNEKMKKEHERKWLESEIKKSGVEGLGLEVLKCLPMQIAVFKSIKEKSLERTWTHGIDLEEYVNIEKKLRQSHLLKIVYDPVLLEYRAEIEDYIVVGKSLNEALNNLEQELNSEYKLGRKQQNN